MGVSVETLLLISVVCPDSGLFKSGIKRKGIADTVGVGKKPGTRLLRIV